jgi:flagellar protein FlaG
MSIPLQAGAVIDWSVSAAAQRAMFVTGANAKVSQASTAPEGKASNQADGQNQRLVIEQDKPTGSFVYKTVDRVNGDILYQYPSDELLRLRNNPDYVSGALFSKSA